MSFLKKLFGGGSDTSTQGKSGVIDEAIYEGYTIRTLEMKEGGQFRVCADIIKDAEGEAKTHKLIRADVCSTSEEASQIAMRKAKQVIKEQGDGIFE